MMMSEFGRIYAKKANCAINVTRQLLDGFTEAMSECLARGERVHITGLGSFFVVNIPARDQYDPNTGEFRTVPPYKQVRFKPSPKLRAFVEESNMVWDPELGYGVDSEEEWDDE